ncbi:DegV family protein [Clostridium sp.]|uniref:DegV family protein n=1 Tax=Clostridium sp. TaxID=1506 RepID=UPI00321792CE
MKNNITIVCDSSVDLTVEFMRERNIEFLSLLVDLNGHVYKDKIDLSNKEFYEAIKHKDTIVKTSQVTPYEFEKFFKKELECGNKVICLTCSGKLSGTNSSANIAKMHLEEGSENIFIVDTLVASGGFGCLATAAVDMRDKGYTVEKILYEINDLVRRLETLIVMETVDMLKRGGRISSGKAIVSHVLGIKPIITVIDGALEPCGKARGMNKALKHVIDIMKTRELDPKYQIVVSHANDFEAANQTAKLIEAELGINKILINEIGTAVGTHSGAGALAIFFIKNK